MAIKKIVQIAIIKKALKIILLRNYIFLKRFIRYKWCIHLIREFQ